MDSTSPHLESAESESVESESAESESESVESDAAPEPEPAPAAEPAPVAVEPTPSESVEAPAHNKKIRRDDAPKQKRSRSRSGLEPNNVRKLRQEAMMSKAELARRAGVSPLTIDRVEAGSPCRMDTKRKILEALGLKPSARTEVWPDIDAQS